MSDVEIFIKLQKQRSSPLQEPRNVSTDHAVSTVDTNRTLVQFSPLPEPQVRVEKVEVLRPLVGLPEIAETERGDSARILSIVKWISSSFLARLLLVLTWTRSRLEPGEHLDEPRRYRPYQCEYAGDKTIAG